MPFGVPILSDTVALLVGAVKAATSTLRLVANFWTLQLPEANSILANAHSWIEEGGDRVKFYSPRRRSGALRIVEEWK